MDVKPYPILVPAPLLLADWLHKKHCKYTTAHTADTIDNLQRLFRLKETGIITEEEFQYLKHQLMEQI